MEFARTFWASLLFIGGSAFLLWLFKPGVEGVPSNWTKFVNRFFVTPPVVLSSGDLEDANDGRSVSQTDQTDDRQTEQTDATPVVSAKKLLTVYALMREYNIPREKARTALKAAGLPLDSNVWAQAAPPADDPAPRELVVREYGRERRLAMTDPDFPYEAPPA